MSVELPDDIASTVRRALVEDVGSGDVTAALVSSLTRARAVVISREAAVLCGCAWFEQVFRQLDARVKVHWQICDGDPIASGQTICELDGPARALLTGERTALNFLQTLSGTATAARQHADAVTGLATVILDTRKTVPGLRSAQKYAVAVGGCRNHRKGLFDGILIKENHLRALGSVTQAVTAAKSQFPKLPVEVEVETLEQLQEAVAAGADQVLLDNFDLPRLRGAVTVNGGRARLEASGGITLENLRAVAQTGVDAISMGSLTKNLRAIDLSMKFVPADTAVEAEP